MNMPANKLNCWILVVCLAVVSASDSGGQFGRTNPQSPGPSFKLATSDGGFVTIRGRLPLKQRQPKRNVASMARPGRRRSRNLHALHHQAPLYANTGYAREDPPLPSASLYGFMNRRRQTPAAGYPGSSDGSTYIAQPVSDRHGNTVFVVDPAQHQPAQLGDYGDSVYVHQPSHQQPHFHPHRQQQAGRQPLGYRQPHQPPHQPIFDPHPQQSQQFPVPPQVASIMIGGQPQQSFMAQPGPQPQYMFSNGINAQGQEEFVVNIPPQQQQSQITETAAEIVGSENGRRLAKCGKNYFEMSGPQQRESVACCGERAFNKAYLECQNNVLVARPVADQPSQTSGSKTTLRMRSATAVRTTNRPATKNPAQPSIVGGLDDVLILEEHHPSVAVTTPLPTAQMRRRRLKATQFGIQQFKPNKDFAILPQAGSGRKIQASGQSSHHVHVPPSPPLQQEKFGIGSTSPGASAANNRRGAPLQLFGMMIEGGAVGGSSRRRLSAAIDSANGTFYMRCEKQMWRSHESPLFLACCGSSLADVRHLECDQDIAEPTILQFVPKANGNDRDYGDDGDDDILLEPIAEQGSSVEDAFESMMTKPDHADEDMFFQEIEAVPEMDA